jgi:hypothetical protein
LSYPVQGLTAQLVAAGIPVQCVSDNGDGTFAITLVAGSTPLQQTQANALAKAYIDAPRAQRPIAAIYTDIQALTTAQQQKLMCLAIAYLLQQNPTVATALGINVAGDQLAT